MRRPLAVLLALVLLAGLAVAGAPTASAGTCGGGQVEVRGRVTDAATGLPLTQVTSVEVSDSGGPFDGFATNPDTSRYSICLDPGTWFIKFVADDYRGEWWNNQPNFTVATEVVVAAPGPIVANAALTPVGRVLSGRVTNLGGVPKFASVGIWRRNPAGTWVSIDGIGNDMPSGIWSFRVPRLGRYRISVFVDSHWARWYDDDTRLRHARVVVVDEDTEFINGLDVRVPYCHAAPDFCVPPGFNT